MRNYLILILALPLLLMGFQNCGRAGALSSGSANTSEQVIGSTSSYDKIVYDSSAAIPADQKPQQIWARRVDVDLQTGMMQLSNGDLAQPISCPLDPTRLEALKDILANGQICQPGPMPPDTMVCMAIAPLDIDLSDSSGLSGSVQLRQPICDKGPFLCAGQDTKFRAILSDLRDHPPVSCTTD